MRFSPELIFWLTLAATIGTGITGGTVHLTGLVPTDAIPYVTGWVSFITFCVMSFLTAATGMAGVGTGPLAKPPTVDEAKHVMAVAQAAKKEGSDASF